MNESGAQGQATDRAAMVMPSRDKYWEERTDAEKIEVLRDEVASLFRVTITQASTIQQLLAHQHTPNGSLVVPLPDPTMNRALGSPGYGLFTADNSIPHRLRTKRERADR